MAGTHIYLLLRFGLMFESLDRVDKGREWTERAVLLDPDLGDIWAMYYTYELQ